MEWWFQRVERAGCWPSFVADRIIHRSSVGCAVILPGLPDDGFSCTLSAQPFDRPISWTRLRVAVQRWCCPDSFRQGLSRCALKAWCVPGGRKSSRGMAHCVAAPIEDGATIALRATVSLGRDFHKERFCVTQQPENIEYVAKFGLN